MGKFKFGYNFLGYTPVGSNTDPNYPDSNLNLYFKPLQVCRTTVTTQVTFSIDFGVAKAVLAAMLNDVNFTSVYFSGSADNATWGAEQHFTIGKDERVQRYKIFAALDGFNNRYLRIRIPGQATTDGAAFFRIGAAVFMDTVLELAEAISYPYDYSADEEILTSKMPSGGEEDTVLGDAIWQGSFGTDPLSPSNEGDYWTLNAIGKSGPLVFFENLGDTSKVYICRRRSAIQVSWKTKNRDSIQKITFKEIR
jgi:hypothetical protein